jgi:HEAT repeat protein
MLPALCLLGLGLSGWGSEREPVSADEQSLKAAGLATDGPSLLQFFHKRTQPETDRQKLQGLVRQLGIGTPTDRERAAGELVSQGLSAVPLLRQAVKDPDDRDLLPRARRCLEAIENPALPAAAARLLAQTKPEGTADALLAYLPFADDESVVEEIQTSLSTVAVHDGKAATAVLAALHDPVPVRRWTAAVALCQAGGVQQVGRVRPLLQDLKPTVRLQVALALGRLHEADAVPVLVALLSEVPARQAQQVEDFLRSLAGEQAPSVRGLQDAAGRSRSRAAWATWWSAADADTLVRFFRKRTLADGDDTKVRTLIQQLGDDAFDVRERASSELMTWGEPVAPLLRRAAQSADAEVAGRARDCLGRLESNKEELSPATAARLLALRRPAGTAEVLLAYLPSAEDDLTTEAIQEALNTIAEHGQGLTELKQALEDRIAVRRSAAAIALCRSGSGEAQAVRSLLKDPDVTVRLRAAVALAGLQEREAIPALIGLVGDLRAGQGWQAEEILLRLAGDRAPRQDFGADEEGRKKARAAWETWWQTNGRNVDLTRLVGPPPTLGYTLLVQLDINGNNGRVGEIDSAGRPLWRILGLRFPVDAHVLPGNRVLVSEHYGMRVSERDFQGNILWEKQVTMPINCQRLANGHTFIACRNQLLEVDRSGKEILAVSRPAHDVMAGCKLRDGQMICLTSGGMCVRLDATGKEVKSFVVGQCLLGGVDVLPNGHVLAAQYANNKVVEFDRDGHEVWQATVTMPSSAVRLPNGSTLVASQATQHVVELDRAKNVIWGQKAEARPWRARRR